MNKIIDLPFTISFIGVGPQKTGSTWLHEVLKNHPDICLPSLVKEIQFFDLYHHKGLDLYKSFFKHCSLNQVRGEITPSYFDVLEVPDRIYKLFPESKIIITLRHPVKRVESLFRHHLRKGRISKNFSVAINQMPRIVDSGKYSLHIARWYEFFNPRQIHIVLMEDIIKKPEMVLKDILGFIGVDDNYNPSNLYNKINKTGMPKFPVLASFAAKLVWILRDLQLHKLIEVGKSLGLKKIYDGGKELPSLTIEEKYRMLSLYEEDIIYVENLLGRDLSSWKEI